MEGTLIRNLSDHSGNNLLHVMAVFGHLAPLAWLLTTQQVLVDALHDENKFGLTPLVCAIKVRKLHTIMVAFDELAPVNAGMTSSHFPVLTSSFFLTHSLPSLPILLFLFHIHFPSSL